jgi:hypothetical protein
MEADINSSFEEINVIMEWKGWRGGCWRLDAVHAWIGSMM